MSWNTAVRGVNRIGRKYSINYVLGRETMVLVVSATDRDDAYYEARSWLVRRRLFSASLQGSCRPASQDDIDAWELEGKIAACDAAIDSVDTAAKSLA